MLRKISTPPPVAFPGRNYITPEIIAYYELQYRGQTVYAEISKGQGIDRQKIVGVTIHTRNGERVEDNPSRMVSSEGHALAWLREIEDQEEG